MVNLEFTKPSSKYHWPEACLARRNERTLKLRILREKVLTVAAVVAAATASPAMAAELVTNGTFTTGLVG
jgi:hypothetical protein